MGLLILDRIFKKQMYIKIEIYRVNGGEIILEKLKGTREYSMLLH